MELLRESPLRRRKRARDGSSRGDARDGSRTAEAAAEANVYVLHLVAQSPALSSSGDVDGGGGGPAVVSFGTEGTRLGRDPGCCDVVLSSSSISRLHTVLSVIGEDVCVHDKSHNGTFINGRLLGRGRCAVLRDGDMLSFVNPLLPEVRRFSYTLEVPPALRLTGGGGGCHGTGAFASLQRAGLTRYTLGPSIGQGSFAVVRLGVNRETGERVAVKVLEKRRFFSEEAFTSLHVEVEMLRSMVHPNVVRVLDAFEAPDMVALVMEYVQGGDLFDYIVGRGRNPFTEDEARFLFVQLLEAVLYIHSRRIVHCDLKPENVLVDTRSPSPLPARGGDAAAPADGGKGGAVPISAVSVVDDHQGVAKSVSPFHVRLKLTDFGVAKYYGEACTADDGDDQSADEGHVSGKGGVGGGGGGGVGTARYAAPEQLFEGGNDGVVLTAAVDIWALGVLLYVMCAGGLPACPQRDVKVRFSRHMSHLSDACKELIQSMMELDPRRRIRLHDICSHPWLAEVDIAGKALCGPDEDDVMSATTILSPRLGYSLRPSDTLTDATNASALASQHPSPVR